MSKEIERKWLVKGIPDNNFIYHGTVHQAYLQIAPTEIRIRERYPWASPSEVNYKLSIKTNGTLVRDEFETDVSEEFYNELLEHIGLKPIEKDYYIFMNPHVLHPGEEKLTVEFSHVDGDWWYAEVEFPSVEMANSYIFPWADLVEKEVTDEYKYKMKNYWEWTRLS